jgi:hypothetical protein
MNEEDNVNYYDQMMDNYNGMPEPQGGMGGYGNPFGGQDQDNMLKWQLDLSEDLDRIYHLLHGHRIHIDNAGNITYKEPDNINEKPFNEHGVQLIMNVLSFYLNRNTILSNYDDKTIKLKVYDFGIELTDLIFTKYQEMGMDTQNKRKLYPMICRELIDTVHSAYMRAFNGGERSSLRKTMHYSQVDNGQPMGIPQTTNGGQQKKSRWYNPTSWF